jgi:hypothetical protein
MADLNVQPKRRAAVWPWLLLIVIIAIVAYFLLRDKGAIATGTGSDSTSQQHTDTVNKATMDSSVDTYRTDTIHSDTTAR